MSPLVQWWTRSESNRRPPGCKPGVLPLNYGPKPVRFSLDLKVQPRSGVQTQQNRARPLDGQSRPIWCSLFKPLSARPICHTFGKPCSLVISSFVQETRRYPSCASLGARPEYDDARGVVKRPAHFFFVEVLSPLQRTRSVRAFLRNVDSSPATDRAAVRYVHISCSAR